MSEENNNPLLRLIARYLNGTATDEERMAAESYYDLFSEKTDEYTPSEQAELDAIGHDIKQSVNDRIHAHENRLKIWQQRPFQLAAFILLLLGAVWLIKIYQLSDTQPLSAQNKSIAPTDSINRFILLPDGSKVVLRRNSQLKLDHEFNQSQRVVFLTGEAFFDVAHNPSSPFVIYTGKVKTTVLGTAFNIKAWPGQKNVTVSVSRGKVRVEEPNKLLALLTADKQLIYNTTNSIADEKQVEATKMITWLQEDVTFDDLTFKDIANLLSKRYASQIMFKNPELEKCRFTGRFTGTETLEETLKTLTITSNTKFKITDGLVIIEGEKCD